MTKTRGLIVFLIAFQLSFPPLVSCVCYSTLEFVNAVHDMGDIMSNPETKYLFSVCRWYKAGFMESVCNGLTKYINCTGQPDHEITIFVTEEPIDNAWKEAMLKQGVNLQDAICGSGRLDKFSQNALNCIASKCNEIEKACDKDCPTVRLSEKGSELDLCRSLACYDTCLTPRIVDECSVNITHFQGDIEIFVDMISFMNSMLAKSGSQQGKFVRYWPPGTKPGSCHLLLLKPTTTTTPKTAVPCQPKTTGRKDRPDDPPADPHLRQSCHASGNAQPWIWILMIVVMTKIRGMVIFFFAWQLSQLQFSSACPISFANAIHDMGRVMQNPETKYLFSVCRWYKAPFMGSVCNGLKVYIDCFTQHAAPSGDAWYEGMMRKAVYLQDALCGSGRLDKFNKEALHCILSKCSHTEQACQRDCPKLPMEPDLEMDLCRSLACYNDCFAPGISDQCDISLSKIRVDLESFVDMISFMNSLIAQWPFGGFNEKVRVYYWPPGTKPGSCHLLTPKPPRPTWKMEWRTDPPCIPVITTEAMSEANSPVITSERPRCNAHCKRPMLYAVILVAAIAVVAE